MPLVLRRKTLAGQSPASGTELNMKRVLLSWSSGKDSAWTLHVLRRDPSVTVVGLLTTFNESADRVAMHAVRHVLVEAQARAAGLPVWPVMLPWPCSNEFTRHACRKRSAERGGRA